MEKLDISTTKSTDLPHLPSSFPSSVLSHVVSLVKEAKPSPRALCPSPLAFARIPQLPPLFLASWSPSSLPWIIPIRQKASKLILNYHPLLKSPLDSTPYLGCHPLSLHPSQENFCQKSSTHISFTLSPPMHSWADLFWFLPYGYKNSRWVPAFRWPELGVHLPSASTLLELQEKFHTVISSQLLWIHFPSARVPALCCSHSSLSFRFFSASLAGSCFLNTGPWPQPVLSMLYSL